MGIIHLEDSNGQEKRQIYFAQTINYVHNFSAPFPKSICAFFCQFLADITRIWFNPSCERELRFQEGIGSTQEL